MTAFLAKTRGDYENDVKYTSDENALIVGRATFGEFLARCVPPICHQRCSRPRRFTLDGLNRFPRCATWSAPRTVRMPQAASIQGVHRLEPRLPRLNLAILSLATI